jgi:hypothetical protein
MTARRRVLCSVDVSDSSRCALGHAGALARWYGARLPLLPVFVASAAADFPACHLDERWTIGS